MSAMKPGTNPLPYTGTKRVGAAAMVRPRDFDAMRLRTSRSYAT